MGEPMNFVYCIIGLFMLIWISGCSSHYTYHDICISNISRPIDKINLTSKDAKKDQHIFSDNMLLNSFNKNSNIFGKNFRRHYDYSNKGSYSACCYTVKPGDTLFYIAWITGNNYYVLADKNNISVHDVLKVGQILHVGGKNQQLNNNFFKQLKNNTRNIQEQCHASSCLNLFKLSNSDSGRDDHITKNKFRYISNKNFMNLLSLSSQDLQLSNNKKDLKGVGVIGKKKKLCNVVNQSSIEWNWPAYGKIIGSFSAVEGGNKGIDISGVVGQPVFSASSGKVVYAGNALVGYGNLIIIKHNDDFLSTYAHNDRILVVEQQYVKGGQKIAIMGNTESKIIKLYFEIRYKGKSVDPLYYLPKR